MNSDINNKKELLFHSLVRPMNIGGQNTRVINYYIKQPKAKFFKKLLPDDPAKKFLKQYGETILRIAADKNINLAKMLDELVAGYCEGVKSKHLKAAVESGMTYQEFLRLSLEERYIVCLISQTKEGSARWYKTYQDVKMSYRTKVGTDDIVLRVLNRENDYRYELNKGEGIKYRNDLVLKNLHEAISQTRPMEAVKVKKIKSNDGKYKLLLVNMNLNNFGNDTRRSATTDSSKGAEKREKQEQYNEAKELELKKWLEEKRELQKKIQEDKERKIKEEEQKRAAAAQAALEEERKKKERTQEAQRRKQEMLKKLPAIGFRDFVVRRTVFKCMHNSHHIDNIDASVQVMDDRGNIHLMAVSAGYCRSCKTYFIMEDSYERIKRYGTILCRISDEKSYVQSMRNGNMVLAQQSILMQYGYNVSMEDNLSATRRHKILALIIDAHILSKSEVLSYLTFFISQRQYNDKYVNAIEKWENDKEFVNTYRRGEYTKLGVRGIMRY